VNVRLNAFISVVTRAEAQDCFEFSACFPRTKRMASLSAMNSCVHFLFLVVVEGVPHTFLSLVNALE
jgi:hypothetical protein